MIALANAANGIEHFGFAPDHLRAARLDQLVRGGLVDSLAIIFDNVASCRGADGRIESLLRRIRAGAVSPALFGAYVELVLAAFDERDAEVETLVQEILQGQSAETGDLRIVRLDDRDLGEGQAARYCRLLRADIAGEITLLDPANQVSATAHLMQALELLEAGAPDVYREARSLIRQIVLVAPAAGPADAAIGGASSFSLWGAIVLNADAFGDRLDVAVSLAHEAAHSHLFGLALGGRLTENDDAERYTSPLRQDPRPMEGVAHATYVTARVIYMLEALIRSGRLSADEATSAREQLRRNEQTYDQGLAVVSAHALLAPSGAAAFSAMRRHMEARRRADCAP